MIVFRNRAGLHEYKLNGEFHRPNGPAREIYIGRFHWYLYGLPHRYYGPSEHTMSSIPVWMIHGTHVKNEA